MVLLEVLLQGVRLVLLVGFLLPCRRLRVLMEMRGLLVVDLRGVVELLGRGVWVVLSSGFLLEDLVDCPLLVLLRLLPLPVLLVALFLLLLPGR